MHTARFRSITLILIFATVILSACQPSSNGPKIVTSDVWGRPSPEMAMTGVVYAVIENKGNEADRLVSVTSAAAKTVGIHESYMDDNGVMAMRPVEDGLEIPAGSTVEFKPGSYHIMLVDLVKPLELGDKITVTLLFEKSGEITLEAEIREQ